MRTLRAHVRRARAATWGCVLLLAESASAGTAQLQVEDLLSLQTNVAFAVTKNGHHLVQQYQPSMAERIGLRDPTGTFKMLKLYASMQKERRMS